MNTVNAPTIENASILKRDIAAAKLLPRNYRRAAPLIAAERQLRTTLGDDAYDAAPMAPKPRPYVEPAPVSVDTIALPARRILTLPRVSTS